MESFGNQIETPLMYLDAERSAAIRVTFGEAARPEDFRAVVKEITALTPLVIPSPDAMRRAITELFGG